MIFAKEAIDSRPPRLYYLIYQKRKTHAKDTQELIKKISYLRELFKKYHMKNSDKPTATSILVDKNALFFLIAICLEAKIVLLNSYSNKNLSVQLCCGKHCWKPMSRHQHFSEYLDIIYVLEKLALLYPVFFKVFRFLIRLN